MNSRKMWTSTACHCCISWGSVPCSVWICKDHKVFWLYFSVSFFSFLFLPRLLTRTSCWSASVSLWRWNRSGSHTQPLPACTSVLPSSELRCAILCFFSPLFCLLRYEAKSSSIKGNIHQSVGDGINFGGGLVSWFLAVVLQHEFSVDHIAT